MTSVFSVLLLWYSIFIPRIQQVYKNVQDLGKQIRSREELEAENRRLREVIHRLLTQQGSDMEDLGL